jgi:hypothetical protein
MSHDEPSRSEADFVRARNAVAEELRKRAKRLQRDALVVLALIVPVLIGGAVAFYVAPTVTAAGRAAPVAVYDGTNNIKIQTSVSGNAETGELVAATTTRTSVAVLLVFSCRS